MSKFSRFLLGTAVVTVAAVGVYECLKQNTEEKETSGGAKADASEAKDGAAGEAAESSGSSHASCGISEENGTFDADREKQDAEDSEKKQDYAGRAYTTIRRGVEQAADKINKDVVPAVKQAFGPRREEVLHTIGDAAGKVKDVVSQSAAQVADIVSGKGKETHYSTVSSSRNAEQTEAEPKAGADAESGTADKDAAVQPSAEPLSADEEERDARYTEIPVHGPEDEKAPEDHEEHSSAEVSASSATPDEAGTAAAGSAAADEAGFSASDEAGTAAADEEDLLQQGMDMIDAAQNM